MYRFLLTPRWIALVLAGAVAMVAMAWLGSWQLSRFNADRAPTAADEPAAVAELADPGRPLPPEAERRYVEATGRFDPQGQVLVPGRGYDGRAGFLVVTGLETAEGTLPVARGWVPAPEDPAATVPSGTVTVRGVLRAPEPAEASGVPAGHRLAPDQVATITPASLAPHLAAPSYEGFLLATAVEPTVAPAPALLPVDPVAAQPGGHTRNLAYGLQWWLFALFVGGFLVRAARVEAADRAAAALVADGTTPTAGRDQQEPERVPADQSGG